jgi:hypothetical protein
MRCVILASPGYPSFHQHCESRELWRHILFGPPVATQELCENSSPALAGMTMWSGRYVIDSGLWYNSPNGPISHCESPHDGELAGFVLGLGRGAVVQRVARASDQSNSMKNRGWSRRIVPAHSFASRLSLGAGCDIQQPDQKKKGVAARDDPEQPRQPYAARTACHRVTPRTGGRPVHRRGSLTAGSGPWQSLDR